MTANILSLAKDCGFSVAAELDVGTLKFLPEVRQMCAADRCRSYGKSWACPPACGSLEDLQVRAAKYLRGVLLQTVGEREDSFDIEAMLETEKENALCFDRLTDALRRLKADFFAMSAGTCVRCEKCTYPDAPCRFPDRLFPSMEACGLFVSGVCRDNGVKYYYGDGKIAYTCCVLYNA